jgi:hypothetical protein
MYYENYINDIEGDNSCVYPGGKGYRQVYFAEPENNDMLFSETHLCPMIIDKIESGTIDNFSSGGTFERHYRYSSENQKYTDVSGVPEGDKCFDVDRYTIRFIGYDRSFFQDTMIGKKILINTHGSYMDNSVISYIKYEDNTWIVLNIQGSGGHTANMESHDIVPEISATQIPDDNCKEICIEADYGVKIITDYTYQPPVEITIDGEEAVKLRNGESKVVGNYEYFADFSVTVSENDPDGKFTIGGDVDPCPSENGQFYFSILNIGALK